MVQAELVITRAVADVMDFFCGGDVDVVAAYWQENPELRDHTLGELVEQGAEWGYNLQSEAIAAVLDDIVNRGGGVAV